MGDLLERLSDYHSRNEWGDKVHHSICTEAAAEIERLTETLERIADHYDMDGLGEDAWKNLALEMAQIAQEALTQGRGSNRVRDPE